jgi:predicted nucleic acid-binding protein
MTDRPERVFVDTTVLVDGLIAATARLHDLRVATHNRKHFPMLDDVIVPY